MNSLMRKQFVLSSATLKEDLCKARRITICLDGWSKKSLSSSYLGISACYCDVTAESVQSVAHVPASGDASASSLSLLTPPTSLQRFKFLANNIQSSQLTTAGASSYISERDAIAAIYAQQLYS